VTKQHRDKLTDEERNRRRAESARRYYERNREKCIAASLASRSKKPDEYRAAQAEYREREADRIRDRDAQYTEERRAERTESMRRWRAANPEKERAINRLKSSMRRAMQRNASGKVSIDIADRLMTLQQGKCTVCRCDLRLSGYHLDHRIPLALGGAHEDRNIELLCPTCNTSKQAKHPVDFMQSRGFLL
jgi:5-methylcytosine-specific restriction endonuclease McrA